jgi:hypothetical protein
MISLPQIRRWDVEWTSVFPPHFFFVGRAWLFQPFFFSFSPIIIFHYSLITTINIIIYILFISLSVEGHGIAVAPWRLASTIITIIILLHLSIYSSSSSTSSSLYIPVFSYLFTSSTLFSYFINI